MLKLISTALFMASCFLGCTQTNNDKKMKKTAEQLLEYLVSCDTASIVRLYFGYSDTVQYQRGYTESMKPILEDCSTVQKIVDKYGLPKKETFIARDGFNGSHEIVINFFNLRDTTFKMNYFNLIISFYPFNLAIPDRIFRYSLEIGKDKKKIEPLIKPPYLIKDQKLRTT
jgi:hypothetical protein